MRVLFLYPYLPAPGLGHGSARLVSRILEDVKEQAEVTLVCAYRPGEREHVDAVRPLCHRLFAVERPFASDMRRTRRTSERAATGIRLVSSRLPLPVIKLRRGPIRRAVSEALREARPDVVHVELAVMAQYVEGLPAKLPAVLVDHEAAGPPDEERSRWRAYVHNVYTRFDRILTLSDEDRSELRRIEPGLEVGVRPPGLSYVAEPVRRPEPNRVLFFGSQDHAPNRDALAWLIDELHPLLVRKGSDVRLVVAGSIADDDLAGRARSHGIDMKGFVPDLDTELARAAVVISPVRLGRGVRMKNLETMAHGVPLVTTPLGAQGFDATDGEHCRIERSNRGLVRATLKLLAEPEAAEAMAVRGREHVLRRHHPDLQRDATLALWNELASRGPAPASPSR